MFWNNSQMIYQSYNGHNFGDLSGNAQFGTNALGAVVPEGLVYQVGALEGLTGVLTNPVSMTFTGGILTGVDPGDVQTKSILYQVFDPGTAVVTGDVAFITIPAGLDGWTLYNIQAHTYTSNTNTAIVMMMYRSLSVESNDITQPILNSNLIIKQGYRDSLSGSPTHTLNEYALVAEGCVLKLNVISTSARAGLDIRLDFKKI
jgi:hypothetical protein